MKTAEQILLEKNREMVTVPSGTSIQDALKVMINHNIGSILIKKDTQIVGIWTERDLMRDILTESFNPAKALIDNYMTTGLHTAMSSDSIYKLLDKFLGMRLRHLLIEKDGKIIGIVSMGDVIKTSLIEKTEELKELNTIISWEYYENWGWKGK
jgi:signal-transduction protein with cAMP-binding, CBS, and nucleotidyltransferase domain